MTTHVKNVLKKAATEWSTAKTETKLKKAIFKILIDPARVEASADTFFKHFDKFLKDPQLVGRWNDEMKFLPLTEDGGTATEDDLLNYIAQHGPLAGHDDLSDYETEDDWALALEEKGMDFHDEWEKVVRAYIEQKIESDKKSFKRHAEFVDGKLKIYRALLLAKKLDVSNFGIYWSYNKGEVHSHWGRDRANETVFTALVKLKDINFKNTFYKWLHPITGGEAEIEVNKGTKLQIIEQDEEPWTMDGSNLVIALCKTVIESDFKAVKKKFLGQGLEEDLVEKYMDSFKDLRAEHRRRKT